jgi:Holliday junction resolvase RusA-like endonuclease
MLISYFEAREAARDLRHALAELLAEHGAWDSTVDAQADMLMMNLIERAAFYRHTRVEGVAQRIEGAIPLSVSVNAAYATDKTGKRVRSAALAEFKKTAADKLAQISYIYHRNPLPPGQVYRLTLYAYFSTDSAIHNRDTDNVIKAAQDAIMQAVRVDDRWIYDVRAIKAGVDPIQSRIEFVLEQLRGDQLAAGLLAQPGRKA